jgi:CRISPR-associated protein (TIGR02710 family)
MAKNILLLTVGGSPDPLLTSVQDLQPDQVVFFASELTRKCVDGPGKPNERRRGPEVEKLDNLVTLMGLSDYDVVVLEDIDDVQSCYQQMIEKVQALRADGGPQQISVDYTGGTKTMSAALVMVAVDEGLGIHITTGIRDNTRAVQRGQATRDVGVTDLRTRRILDRDFSAALKAFDFGAAERHLHSLLRPRDLSKSMRGEIQLLRSICQALGHWDLFHHTAALECVDSTAFSRLSQVREGVVEPLRKLVNVRAWLVNGGDLPKNASGYELVDDLLWNARRRAQRGRYDDAVGRFYRALEMLAQVRLRLKYGIDTGKVRAEQLPETLVGTYLSAGESEAALGLRKAYWLLRDLGDEPVGSLFKVQENALVNALTVRNHSLFAHGYQPIGRDDYLRFCGFAENFLEQLLDQLFGKCKRGRQLPASVGAILGTEAEVVAPR